MKQLMREESVPLSLESSDKTVFEHDTSHTEESRVERRTGTTVGSAEAAS